MQAKYSGTDAADVAGLYMARIAAARGDVKTAKPLLETFVKEQKDHMLVGAARFSLYQMRIEGGEAATVAVELNAELAKPEPVLPGDSLLAAPGPGLRDAGQRREVAGSRTAASPPSSPSRRTPWKRSGACELRGESAVGSRRWAVVGGWFSRALYCRPPTADCRLVMHILSLLILALWLLAFGRTILNLALVPRLRGPGFCPLPSALCPLCP